MVKRMRKKERVTAVRVGQLATPERRQQQGGVLLENVEKEPGEKLFIKRHRATFANVLDFYFYAGRMDEAQYKAALKFQEIYGRCFEGQGFKLQSQALICDGGSGSAELKVLGRLDAQKHLQDVYRLLDQREKQVIIEVCGFNRAAGDKYRVKILLAALDRLALFWHYK